MEANVESSGLQTVEGFTEDKIARDVEEQEAEPLADINRLIGMMIELIHQLVRILHNDRLLFTNAFVRERMGESPSRERSAMGARAQHKRQTEFVRVQHHRVRIEDH